jgi:GT2 family glycosyltransferase
MIKVSIIIVNWNSTLYLNQCLDSIRNTIARVEYEVLVVDNASDDFNLGQMTLKYEWVRYIVNKTNEGFARGNNIALKMAAGEYILLLNPDIVLKKNAVEEMLRTMDSDLKVGIVGPRILREDGSVAMVCRRNFPSLFNSFFSLFFIDNILHKIFKKIYLRPFYKTGSAKCLSGACLLIRKKYFDVIGFFDEIVPMYLDDIDLCYRYWSHGYSIVYCSTAEIIHFEGKSTKKSNAPYQLDVLSRQAIGYFFLKHKSLTYFTFYRGLLFVSSAISLFAIFILWPVHNYFVGGRIRVKSFIKKQKDIFKYSLTQKIYVRNFTEYKGE